MAELITVYFLSPDGLCVKAIVPLAHIAFFEGMGAKRQPEELLTEEKESLPEYNIEKEGSTEGQAIDEDVGAVRAFNPDQGSGRPGSAQFHTLSIMELQTIDAVSVYLQTVTGLTLDNRIKRLDTAKNTAINIIEDWIVGHDRQDA